ncbi:MAG: hypothetical protein KatS3mg057_0382 [Herpetosiphonaceae bacterium]|nr:MAG: hypothetical protein KatS3mg057_0382 [Herpetosiphonaceae bacterium]
MAQIVGLFKSNDDASDARTELHHRGIGKTEIENDESAAGGVRLIIYTPAASANDAEKVMWEHGAIRVSRERESPTGP